MARVKTLPRSETIAYVDARSLLDKEHYPPVDPETGCPTSIKSFIVSEEPRIAVVPQFLSQAECDHLIALAEGQWHRSLVATLESEDDHDAPVGGRRKKPSKQTTRTSQSAMLRFAQSVALERIEHRMASLARLPVEQLERVVAVRYSPGEQFSEHHDGKFRPRTIFIYLNDLPDEDDGGDTFFPCLGLSFRPRAGCAVMWSNATPDGDEDSRLLHAGRAPRLGVKYGVNCFFNDAHMRVLRQPAMSVAAANATKVDLAHLVAKHGNRGGTMKLSLVLNQKPDLKAMPCFATDEELEELLTFAAEAGESGSDEPIVDGGERDGPFSRSTRTIRVLEPAQTPAVAGMEERLAQIVGFHVENLAPLRIVRGGSAFGLCNRGCGQRPATLCLSETEEVLFPHLGFSVSMRRGDLLIWPNSWEQQDTGEDNLARSVVVEDMRTRRVHLQGGMCVDASFHNEPIRAEQREEAARAQQLREAMAKQAFHEEFDVRGEQKLEALQKADGETGGSEHDEESLFQSC